MGTRADFYIGKGADAEWLGSVALDGYEWAEREGNALAASTTPEEFRARIGDIAIGRDDFTAPSDGWPWPWNDSTTTDYAYVLHDGQVHVYNFGRLKGDKQKVDWFPNMASRKNIAVGNRSGLIIFGA